MILLARHLRRLGVRAHNRLIARLGIRDKGHRHSRLRDVADEDAEFRAELPCDVLGRDMVKLTRCLAACMNNQMVKCRDTHRSLCTVALERIDIALKNEISRIIVAIAGVAVVHVNHRDIRIAVILHKGKLELARDVQPRSRPCARCEQMRDVRLHDLDLHTPSYFSLSLPSAPRSSFIARFLMPFAFAIPRQC